jgi:hypothetical protein
MSEHESTRDPGDFSWQPQPQAAQLVDQLVQGCVAKNSTLAESAQRLHAETGTRLIDWISTLHFPLADEIHAELLRTGFKRQMNRDLKQSYWRHPDGEFPLIISVDDKEELVRRIENNNDVCGVAVRVDSIADLVNSGRWDIQQIDGDPAGGRNRQVRLKLEEGIHFAAHELHGCYPYEPAEATDEQIAHAAHYHEALVTRRRDWADEADGFRYTIELLAEAAGHLDRDWVCDLFFSAERNYWMSRNHAARVQYARQQRLGFGWGNHDHHTFRSSRGCFALLVAALEHLGFHCRDRFYAGPEAGWGAQVLEHPRAGLVVFADVDLSPDEIAGDFAHQPLPPRDELGTVGLWCALHGESFLAAGMHHLECQFDFDASSAQLAEADVETMDPFTDFAFLRQAFTKGQRWQVEPARIERLQNAGQITAAEAEQFRKEGALGSHLEILERNDGYKGFNQTGVSDIIQRTDPRRMVGA